MSLISLHDIWKAIDKLDTNAIILVTAKGDIENINTGVTSILGYKDHDLVGKRVECLLTGDVREVHASLFDRYVVTRQNEMGHISKMVGKQRFFPALISVEGKTDLRFSVTHKKGYEVPISLTINEVWSQSGDLIGFIAIISDNGVQIALQDRLKHLAEYDQNTGLFTWQKFVNEVYDAKKRIQKGKGASVSSLLYLDVDYFGVYAFRPQREIDHSLKKISNWLLLNIRQEENRTKNIIPSYFMGDRFILYLPSAYLDNALLLARHLNLEFKKLNIGSEERPFFTSISIGAVEIDYDMKLHDAVTQASNACNSAKKKGKDRIEVVSNDQNYDYIRIEPLIRQAINDKRVKLYAQRIMAISKEALSACKDRVYYEILSRMEDKEGNLISPAIFVPAAETLGLAIALDRYVIENTLYAVKNHYSGHERALSLCSINLSALSASNKHMFVFIKEQIRQFGVDPGKISFEITETEQIMDEVVTLDLIVSLRKLGCKVALDDFGIGYSNFQSFSLPVDTIKIDGNYVKNCRSNPQLRADMLGIINSAKSRNLKIVGEFAENEEIVEELISMGVDYAQGYYYGKPMPLETMIEECIVTA